MCSKQESKDYRIFALMIEDVVYVGKTTGKSLAAICYSHIRGENQYTKFYFFLADTSRLKLFVLETLRGDNSLAFRHVVAWTHIFATAGYEVLSGKKTRQYANDLHAETAIIVDEIKSVPLEMILERSYIAKYKNADIKDLRNAANPKPVKNRVDDKLSVRVTKCEKNRFVDFAEHMDMTLREAMQYMISRIEQKDYDNPIGEDDQFVKSLLNTYKRENAELKEEISSLKKRNTAMQQKYSKRFDTVRKGIERFFDYFSSTSRIPVLIEEGMYEEYKRSLPRNEQYRYPTEAGCGFLYIQASLLGKGACPARFLLGIGEKGEYIKLRFYNKRYFVGLLPWDERFAFRRSCWLVQWENAEDDVMDLVFAVPMQICAEYNDPGNQKEIMSKKIAAWTQRNDQDNE